MNVTIFWAYCMYVEKEYPTNNNTPMAYNLGECNIIILIFNSVLYFLFDHFIMYVNVYCIAVVAGAADDLLMIVYDVCVCTGSSLQLM